MEKMAVKQFNVRTNLRAGASYPDMSGVCKDALPPSGGGTYPPDYSYVCNGGTPPPGTTPPTAGWPDMSGVCV